MTPRFATASDTTTSLVILNQSELEAWKEAGSAADAAWIDANGFKAQLSEALRIPSSSGGIEKILIGWGTGAARARGRFHLASHAATLPSGHYSFEQTPTDFDFNSECLGWLLASYRFDRYALRSPQLAELIAPDCVDVTRIELIAAGALRAQELIDTPASDMGPDALEDVVADLATTFEAQLTVTRGADLLDDNFPMIHAVGRAADQVPRLLDLTWGAADAPKLTLVGKGVCFDTGGLNIKPGSSMGLMKKDMGGAANAIGLAQMIMALDLPVRLRLLIPAVENSISASAFRPQDILTSRKGLTVEINNTDAEGRLVLADALALGDEESPDLMISLATLTGAARVALGPDVPPFYTDDTELAQSIARAAQTEADPLWQMPFWEPYEAMIEPGIADLDNAPSGGFAGSITAALFLRRFVDQAGSYAHFDIYGWTPTAKPARPKGGAHQGIRALLNVIELRYAK